MSNGILTSEELAGQAARGDEDAFTELVARHKSEILSFLSKKTGSWEDAEDLAQETFVRVHKNLAGFDTARSFRSWIRTIADRLAISRARKNRPAIVDIDFIDETFEAPDVDLPYKGEIWETVRSVLKPKWYDTLYLRYHDGLNVEEIAGKMKKTKSWVKVTLFRTRLLLYKSPVVRGVVDFK